MFHLVLQLQLGISKIHEQNQQLPSLMRTYIMLKVFHFLGIFIGKYDTHIQEEFQKQKYTSERIITHTHVVYG